MKRTSKLTGRTIGGLGVILTVLAAQTSVSVEPSPSESVNVRFTQIAASEPGRSMRRPPQGLHSFGKGAVRMATPETATFGSGDSGSDEAIRGTGAPMKISGASMAGSVAAFALSPDGTTAVYIADQETVGLFELYSTPVDGIAAPTQISTGLSFGSGDEGVSSFQISPDSAQVVFLADPSSGAGSDDIFSVPIDGSSAPVQLNAGSETPVTGFAITPDGAVAAFLGTDSNFGTSAAELYAASIGVAASARQVSDAGATNSQGNVVSALFSPDSATVVYAADATADGVFQWFTVPVTATGPGFDEQISTAISFVSLAAVSADSATVVYTGDETTSGVADVAAIPIGGGTAIRLNPPMAGSGAGLIAISPDGDRVAYLADQTTAGVVEVYSASIGVADSGARLNTPFFGAQGADSLTISPDSTTVLYEADENIEGTNDLLGVPIDGSASSSTLHGVTPPANAAIFSGVGTPVIGQRVVYPVFGDAIDIFSVPFDGSDTFTRVNDPLETGNTLRNAFLPVIASRLMAYGLGSDSDTVTTEVYAAPIRPDLASEQINVTAGAGALGILGYEISSDEIYGVYVQDQDTGGKYELYSRELDSDADTVANASDNCAFIANASQDSVTFGQTVIAGSDATFVWDDPAEVRFVRGPLDMLDVLATDDSGTLIDATLLTDVTDPAAGAGFYYLFAPDCPGRSYQTEPGAEPNRDLAAFP